MARGVTLRFEDFLLAVIGFSWFAKMAVKKELGLFLKTPLNKAILFYILSCGISTGVGIMAGRVALLTGSLFVFKYIEYFIIYFMVVNHLKDTDQIRRFIFCLLLTCFITSIIGILQIPGGERVSAPFEGENGEPNTLGGYLLFIGAITAGMLIKTENSRFKHIFILLIITIIPPFLFTESRSSYLGLVPVCLVLGLFIQRRVIIFGLMAVAIILSPFFLPSQVKNRILYTFRQPESSGQIVIGDIRLDTSTSARLVSLKEILGDWLNHPILGYGITGYKFADAQMPRSLIETGILGFMALFYLFYSIMKLAINNLKEIKSPYFRGLTVGFIAGYLGLLIHSLGANTFIIVRIMEPFWFFVGIIAVLPTLERQGKAQPQEMRPHIRKLATVN